MSIELQYPTRPPHISMLSPADSRFLQAHNGCMDCQTTINLSVYRRNRKKVVLCTECAKATVPPTRKRIKTMRKQTVIRNGRAPDNTVIALVNVSKGGRYVQAGTRIDRDDVIVLEAPMSFEVRYRLDTEIVE